MKFLNLYRLLIIVLIQEKINFDHCGIRIKFNENCLKEEKITFTQKQVVTIYIVYEINVWSFTVGQDFTPGNSLVKTVKLTTNANPEEL